MRGGAHEQQVPSLMVRKNDYPPMSGREASKGGRVETS